MVLHESATVPDFPHLWQERADDKNVAVVLPTRCGRQVWSRAHGTLPEDTHLYKGLQVSRAKHYIPMILSEKWSLTLVNPSRVENAWINLTYWVSIRLSDTAPTEPKTFLPNDHRADRLVASAAAQLLKWVSYRIPYLNSKYTYGFYKICTAFTSCQSVKRWGNSKN